MPNIPYKPSGLKPEDMQLICELLKKKDEQYQKVKKPNRKTTNAVSEEEVVYKKVQKVLNIPLSVILEADIVYNKRNKVTEDGLGPLNLRQYIVAVRCRTSTTWDNEDPKVKEARESYDKGEVEIFTLVDGMNVILYCKPLVTKDKYRFKYFSEIESEGE